jgi:WhiB family transcriptional regulator, redox-sensing transcriptional regulator
MLFELTPEPWSEGSVCAQIGGDTWYPEKGGSTATAKKACKVCPVTAECLNYALEHDERFGIWGGMSERQRRPLNHNHKATTEPGAA